MKDVISLDKYADSLKEIDTIRGFGRVSRIVGLMIESIGPDVQIGEICHIHTKDGKGYIPAEVVGLRDRTVLLMPLGYLSGIGFGSLVMATNSSLKVPVGHELVGRILDGLGNPIDRKGPIMTEERYPIDNSPPDPLQRKEIDEVLPMGIRVIDSLLTCGVGQRLGIFSGSGVGKSTLLGMIARYAKADINVVVLVGERGREVNEFINNDLKEDGLKKSVVVVATSDQPALVRLKAAMVGTSIAEYFRDKGMKVLLLVDSLTRFAMAQREIGLAVGEPPVSRGFTPSVFSILPRLLERSGNSDKGSITGIYTVLVDGDDMNEPITDAVRGILDGHIVMSRSLANKNHYPAIDVLASVSRLMPYIVSKEHLRAASKIRNILATYREAQDLINIGAYKKGSNPEIDEAIMYIQSVNNFIMQGIDETTDFDETKEMMMKIIGQEE